MGHKAVCLDCKKSFSQGTDYENRKETLCLNCGKPMMLLSQRFRPPRKTDDKKWETVKFLVLNGFYYQKVYEKIETRNGITSYSNPVKYPENLRDAKEFIVKYKDQSS